MVHSSVNYVYSNCSDFRHLCVDNCDSYERTSKLNTPKKFFEKIKLNPDREFPINGYLATAIVTKDPQNSHAVYIRIGCLKNDTAQSILEKLAEKGLRSL